MHFHGTLTLLLLLAAGSMGSPSDDPESQPILWSDVKAYLFEEPTPGEYFPSDEDFIVVEKNVPTSAPDDSIKP